IVLRVADTYDYLYNPCPNQPFETASEEDKATWKAEYKKDNDVACLMLGKMSPALQKQFESYPSQLMLAELKKMFEKSQAVEIYDLVDALHSYKQASGKSVSAHVLEMKGYMDQLHALGKSYDNDMAINLINRSLNKDFGDFVRNFNMYYVGKTVTELHALLIDYKKGLGKSYATPQVLTIQKGRENKPKPQANKKNKSKGKTDKNKKVVPYQPKPKHNPLKRKENPNKDQTCHNCHVAGHWNRNCPLYLEELAHIGKTRMQKLTSAPSTPTYVHAEENNDNQADGEHLKDDEFINPLCAPTQDVAGSSSHNIGNSNVPTFNQPQVSEYPMNERSPSRTSSIISLIRGIKLGNPHHVMKSFKTSTVYTTTDHNDIEWFRSGEALQAKKAKALKTNKVETSNANRSKSLLKGGFLRKTNHFKTYLCSMTPGSPSGT
nr:hypothetical protein [Tanacetum cinerariifolium]